MVRPRINRKIYFSPEITYFKPAGVILRDLQESVLSKEELEAVRLIDFENTIQSINKSAKEK